MARDCPVCHRPISQWRLFLTSAWGSWTCPDCGSHLGINARRRFMALVPWIAIMFFLMVVVKIMSYGFIFGVLVLMPILFALIALFDRPIVLERVGVRCAKCGYDLQGQIEPVCPECGYELSEAEAALLERVRSGEIRRPETVRQKIAGRARTWQVVMIAAIIIMLALVFAGMVIWRSGSRRAMGIAPETKLLVGSIVDYVQAHHGQPPRHILGPVVDDVLTTHQFVLPGSATDRQRITLGDVSLADFDGLGSERQLTIIDAEGTRLPADVSAYRLGDFVFAYCGIELPARGEAQGLWLVVGWPDPEQNGPPGPGAFIPVGLADGTVRRFAIGNFPAALAAQNALRSRIGAPALAEPGTVTHARPARVGGAD